MGCINQLGVTVTPPQATQLVVGDVDDVFLPSPSDLLANLSNCREQVTLNTPSYYSTQHSTLPLGDQHAV